jgi:hypothetical protein
MLSVDLLSIFYAKSSYSDCHFIVILIVVMLNVIMPSVVAPCYCQP